MAGRAPIARGPGAQGAGEWRSLFDGSSLDGWDETPFGGEGLVRVVNETIVLEFGEPLTGITWRGGPLAPMPYDIRLEAQRLAGNDFFCGLTFPVGASACSLILGGWGGSLVVIDQTERLAVSYVMNRMGLGTLGDERAAGIVAAAYASLAGA